MHTYTVRAMHLFTEVVVMFEQVKAPNKDKAKTIIEALLAFPNHWEILEVEEIF